MNFYIILYFLEIFYNYYFIKIKKLRSYIFFINQIKIYILFFLFLIPPEGNLKSLNLIDIQLVYCSEFIDCIQQYWNFRRYRNKPTGTINITSIKTYQ